MNPGCKITCDMNNSSTKMLQIPRKMRGSNSKMLQTAVEMAASSANMLQIARETDRTGDPKKNPTRKQNNSQNNSGPISSKRKDYMNENGVGGHFIVWELFEPHVARRMAPTLASSSHLRFSAAAQSLAEPCL